MPGNKRIVLVANTSWSIYRFRLYIIQQLIENGFDVYVLAPRDNYTGRFEKLPGLTYTELKQFENRRVSVLKGFRLYKELKAHYKRIQPDLIFHYTIKANILGSIAAGQCHFRSISVITGLGYAFLASYFLKQMAGILYKFTLRFATEVWFLNKDDRDFFIDSGLVPTGKSFILPGEGVDTEAFYPAPYTQGNNNKEITFLQVGRIMKYKGIYEFVEAVKMLQKKGLHIRGRLLGNLEEQGPVTIPRQDIQQWIDQQVITWPGETDNVVPHMAEADCIVLPSYREGLPLSLLEGASMCKFLIAADTAGCREVVTDHVNGYLCHKKDAIDLAAKMEAYYYLPPEAKISMGRKGREKVTEQFRKEIIAGIYLDKIRGYLQEQPASGDLTNQLQ